MIFFPRNKAYGEDVEEAKDTRDVITGDPTRRSHARDVIAGGLKPFLGYIHGAEKGTNVLAKRNPRLPTTINSIGFNRLYRINEGFYTPNTRSFPLF